MKTYSVIPYKGTFLAVEGRMAQIGEYVITPNGIGKQKIGETQLKTVIICQRDAVIDGVAVWKVENWNGGCEDMAGNYADMQGINYPFESNDKTTYQRMIFQQIKSAFMEGYKSNPATFTLEQVKEALRMARNEFSYYPFKDTHEIVSERIITNITTPISVEIDNPIPVDGVVKVNKVNY